jgi:hypothetical protein
MIAHRKPKPERKIRSIRIHASTESADYADRIRDWRSVLRGTEMKLDCVSIKASMDRLRFATRAGAVLTSPYPSVNALARGFVRLR